MPRLYELGPGERTFTSRKEFLFCRIQLSFCSDLSRSISRLDSQDPAACFLYLFPIKSLNHAPDPVILFSVFCLFSIRRVSIFLRFHLPLLWPFINDLSGPLPLIYVLASLFNAKTLKDLCGPLAFPFFRSFVDLLNSLVGVCSRFGFGLVCF